VLLTFGALTWWLGDRQRPPTRRDLLSWLPGLFLLTQFAALPGSINFAVSLDTVCHFAACVLLFYAAAGYVRDGAAASGVFAGLGLATFLIVIFAMEQWMGGLEATRQMVAHMYEQTPLPPDLMRRLQSDRVFSTLVYPNALAGFIAVAFAPVLAWVWVRGRTWEARVKWATLALVGAVMVACLVLTGSRGGFIAFALMVLAGVWGCVGTQRRGVFLGVMIALGVVFAAGTWGGWIGLGGKSAEARLDYWGGAAQIVRDYPWRGTGPGTFGSIYPHYKTGETEEAQVAHNNFLQMWTDSGVAAFAVFLLLWCVGLRDGYRLVKHRPGDAGAIAIFAGLVGWSFHGLVDFDLYVPGVAYPAFMLLGMVQGLKQLPDNQSRGWLARWHWAGKSAAVAAIGIVVWCQGPGLMAGFIHGRVQPLAGINPQAAYALERQAVALSPRNGFYLSRLADLAAGLGRRDEAITYYQAALASDPYRASYHWRLAELLGPCPAGVEHLREAVRLNPTKVDYRQALREFEESVRQHPGHLLDSVPAS
jgi:O-antigen ligase